MITQKCEQSSKKKVGESVYFGDNYDPWGLTWRYTFQKYCAASVISFLESMTDKEELIELATFICPKEKEEELNEMLAFICQK